MGLAFWIGARTSQGAATGTWLRCHDEVSTESEISPESSTKWEISVSPYFREISVSPLSLKIASLLQSKQRALSLDQLISV